MGNNLLKKNRLSLRKLQIKMTGRLQFNLSKIIDIDYGLLDLLRSMGVLNGEQIEIIQSNPITESRIWKMLDYIIKTSFEHQELFMTALERTQQKHVVNYIRLNGQRPTDNTDEWPINIGSEEAKIIDRQWSKLVELIDSRNGLLDEML